MIVSGAMQTRFLCCFKLNMATEQNIKSKPWASEIDTAYCRYIVDWHGSVRKSLFLQFCIYFRKSRGNLFVVDKNLLWRIKTWRCSILWFMKIENWWKLKLLKFLQVLLTVSVIIFSDIISCLAVFCINQHCEQWKGFFERKSER